MRSGNFNVMDRGHNPHRCRNTSYRYSPLLPIACSLLPIAYCLFPVPCSLKKRKRANRYRLLSLLAVNDYALL